MKTPPASPIRGHFPYSQHHNNQGIQPRWSQQESLPSAWVASTSESTNTQDTILHLSGSSGKDGDGDGDGNKNNVNAHTDITSGMNSLIEKAAANVVELRMRHSVNIAHNESSSGEKTTRYGNDEVCEEMICPISRILSEPGGIGTGKYGAMPGVQEGAFVEVGFNAHRLREAFEDVSQVRTFSRTRSSGESIHSRKSGEDESRVTMTTTVTQERCVE